MIEESRIKAHFTEAQAMLEAFLGRPESMHQIRSAIEMMAHALQKGGKIISCGNGGSMSDAMHFAEELSGRYRENRPGMAAIAISDPSHITCVANDFGFEYVFSRFVEAVGSPSDVLLAISTSGNSLNVIKAAEVARSRGMKVIGLTGKEGGALSEWCHVEIRAPHAPYADRTQELHIKIIHALIDGIEHCMLPRS